MAKDREQSEGRRKNGAVPVSEFAKTPPKQMASEQKPERTPASDKPMTR
jgi:hypothetical protein